jgi:hypothetical protein
LLRNNTIQLILQQAELAGAIERRAQKTYAQLQKTHSPSLCNASRLFSGQKAKQSLEYGEADWSDRFD